MPRGVYIKTREHRANLSAALKGRSLSAECIAANREAQNRPEVKAKKSAYSKGKTYVEIYGVERANEIVLKMSEVHTGVKLSAEHSASIGKSHKGEKSHFWEGGISYLPYSFEWTKELKEFIRERDNHQCQAPGCGKTQEENGRKLDVHHIDYDKENCDTSNLISLCISCHMKTNYNRKYWQVVLLEEK